MMGATPAAGVAGPKVCVSCAKAVSERLPHLGIFHAMPVQSNDRSPAGAAAARLWVSSLLAQPATAFEEGF